ncbi:hypothetical protein GCM10011317_52980 [Niveispirillum cyanobacteriorum]|nr:hypothetical protein GCM10011317_52980 [Niveispirillum cyanobacteriorum]
MTSSVTPVGNHNLETNNPQVKGHPHHQFSIGDAGRQPRRYIQPHIDLAQCQHTGIGRQAAPIEAGLNGLARNE